MTRPFAVEKHTEYRWKADKNTFPTSALDCVVLFLVTFVYRGIRSGSEKLQQPIKSLWHDSLNQLNYAGVTDCTFSDPEPILLL